VPFAVPSKGLLIFFFTECSNFPHRFSLSRYPPFVSARAGTKEQTASLSLL